MPRGGRRAGAGRKRSPASEKTRVIADQEILNGDTPLEVLLFVMRLRFADKNYDSAAEIAKHAAPYIHPRLSAVALQKLPDADEQQEPIREIVVSTREEAATLLPMLTQASGIPERF